MQRVLWEGDTDHGHYQVVDTLYDGRPARVLYSGNRQAAQSGIAKDGAPDLLFDYNQRLFELICGVVPRHLLLIGGGVFTLPSALLRALPDIYIDVVEPDAGLPKLATEFFDLPVTDRLAIFTADGRSFLRNHVARYDIIVIDAFVHTAIPRELRTIQAFEAYRAHLRSPGLFAMNVISGYYGSAAQGLQEVYAASLRVFDRVDIALASRGYTLWLPQNFVLVGQNKQNLSLDEYLRYEPVAPPDVGFDAMISDEL